MDGPTVCRTPLPVRRFAHDSRARLRPVIDSVPRIIWKARALHSNMRERAGFRDARSGALHGVTSEASGVSRWRAVRE